nr:uncharacterized protein LOC114821437 [Malus domestica]
MAGPIEPGLYLVRTPIGNLEDSTLQALRVLKSAHVIPSEDTRHSGSLKGGNNVEAVKEGEIVALISDVGMSGISDPGTELVRVWIFRVGESGLERSLGLDFLGFGVLPMEEMLQRDERRR